jgi:hypothetical protein
MNTSFGRFIAIYFAILGWFAVASLLEFSGLDFYILLILSFFVFWGVVSSFLATKIETRFHFKKADDDEIEREDDVLLQGATFVTAILFFYVNTLLIDQHSRILLGLAFSFLTGSFYLLRAYAKIKSRADYRFMSSFFFVWGITSFAFEIAVAIFPALFPTIPELPTVFLMLIFVGLMILFLLYALSFVYFYKRYGSPGLIHKDRNL